MVCVILEKVEGLEQFEQELELEQRSEADSMLGDNHPEVESVLLCSAIGVGYAFRPADVLVSTLEDVLLLLRVRGRPARFAGL
jgi:hypothetical protein